MTLRDRNIYYQMDPSTMEKWGAQAVWLNGVIWEELSEQMTNVHKWTEELSCAKFLKNSFSDRAESDSKSPKAKNNKQTSLTWWGKSRERSGIPKREKLLSHCHIWDSMRNLKRLIGGAGIWTGPCWDTYWTHATGTQYTKPPRKESKECDWETNSNWVRGRHFIKRTEIRLETLVNTKIGKDGRKKR